MCRWRFLDMWLFRLVFSEGLKKGSRETRLASVWHASPKPSQEISQKHSLVTRESIWMTWAHPWLALRDNEWTSSTKLPYRNFMYCHYAWEFIRWCMLDQVPPAPITRGCVWVCECTHRGGCVSTWIKMKVEGSMKDNMAKGISRLFFQIALETWDLPSCLWTSFFILYPPLPATEGLVR